MLTCRDFSEVSTDYLEGALPFRGWAGARFHLAICSHCRTHLDQLQKTRRLLADSTMPAPDAIVEDQLIRSLPEDGFK